MTTWYHLVEAEAREAGANMAIDQYLLEALEQGRIDRPILRIYAWAKPTLSLGYHQEWRRTVNEEQLEKHGVVLVRRWTGGRAVLHDTDEITYSLIAPMREPFNNQVSHNYCAIGRALKRFTDLGESASGAMFPEEPAPAKVRSMRHTPCFASMSRSEIERGGKKMIGSAQKRGKGAFLQHGSIPLHARTEILAAITGSNLDMGELMTSLSNHYRDAGLALPERSALVQRLVDAFAAGFGIDFEPLPGEDPGNAARVAEIRRDSFDNDTWTRRK
ncbi:lipoate--protein ligase family protein [Acanthopleuribacter pedis]|uniref:Lipoate--protein ligase family protein n=1 Tax=Acanthopleuribacter pedis TaxID=442870 RepID=A0A8J7QGE4_9BACT|nr:biotin/lipoate A/B protein ligase family protein [Acanthopleuribacter pedis]MBO1318158.1 lipoate--protein ligase family protein [Acanthopleuribacter pedis]